MIALYCRWLEHLKQVLDIDMDILSEDQMISWAAYHASQQVAPPDDSEVALISMLPLFHDQAKSVAMIRHSMNIVKTAVEILNPGQVPAISHCIRLQSRFSGLGPIVMVKNNL